MAPIILHRALSFSNPPLHRRDVSPLQEASAVSNRPEGLALLTRIAEGTDCCDPSPSLPNHSALEKSLTSKILWLREVLDLPCQSSCDTLDQLLLDTLEVLKIAYPKCLSGLSANHPSSVREGLVLLHRVLILVQDCHAKNKQLSSSGSEKQTTIGSESLDDVGERVIEMLDQVTPVVKEMLSLMESTATAASSTWPEDLPERRSLPRVLCRTRSPAHRGSASNHPSDGDEAAMPRQRQDGTAKHTEHCKAPAPGQEADEGGCTCTREEDGQTSRREPPSTPSPIAVSLTLQSTPSSVSPHLLSAPPPSPMPVVGMPMLLQSWEVTQDGNAAAAVVPPSQPAEAAPTAQEDTSPVSTTMEISTSSASLEAGQPSMDSPSASQPLVQDSNAVVPNVPSPPPPPPLPAHRGRFQEAPPSTDEPGQAVTLTDAPPPPPSEMQGGPPAPPPAAKVSSAPPPPPAPGSISAVVRGKKAATKLKRSTQMGSLYRRLRDRVEGSGITHGDRRRLNGKRPRAAGAPKSDAGGQGMADALAEMTKRSAYFRQIEEDAEKHAAAILEVKDAIGSFQSKDMAELVRFHQHVEQQLACLTDETQVLTRFEGFPSKKLEAVRTAAALYSKLDGAATRLKCWKLTAGPVSPQLDRVESYFNKVRDDVDMVERNRDEEMKRLQSQGVHLDFGVLVRIREGMVDLSSACMELALKESQDATETTTTATTRAQWASSHGDGASRMLWRVFQLAFRVYSFAGGQDERADRLTSILAHEIEARRL